jgi:hypothetical protein
MASFHVVAHLSALAREFGAPQYTEQRFDVDLSRDSFASAFTDVVFRMLRLANNPKPRPEVHEMLGAHAAGKLPHLGKLLERWLSGDDQIKLI